MSRGIKIEPNLSPSILVKLINLREKVKKIRKIFTDNDQ